MDNFAVTGVGSWTSLGGVVASSAAHRAGLTRATELPDYSYCSEDGNEVVCLTGCVAPECEHFESTGRQVQLGTLALRDLLGSLPARPESRRMTAFVAMPPAPKPECLERIFRGGHFPLPEGQVHCVGEGATGFLTALSSAFEEMQSGAADTCIVGALDSNLDPQRLQDLFLSRRVKTAVNPVGMVPGEAAAFLVVERNSDVPRSGRPVLARLYPPTVEREPDSSSDHPPDGRLLSQAITSAVRGAGFLPEDTGTIFVDLNGEPGPALAWGGSLLHLKSQCDVTEWTTDYPLATFGELGIAYAPLAVGLAVRAYQRGYARGRQGLVVTIGREGVNGAFCIEAAA